MSLGIAANRRKPSTYGKVSRKPIFTADGAFVQAMKKELSIDRDEHQNQGMCTLSALPSTQHPGKVQGLISRTESGNSSEPRTILNSNSVQARTTNDPLNGHSSRDNNVFDVPSSEDELALHLSALYSGRRKKRKVSLGSGKIGGSPVYDDAGLQRHIAREIGSRLSESPSRLSSAIVGQPPKVVTKSIFGLEKRKTRSPSTTGTKASEVATYPSKKLTSHGTETKGEILLKTDSKRRALEDAGETRKASGAPVNESKILAPAESIRKPATSTKRIGGDSVSTSSGSYEQPSTAVLDNRPPVTPPRKCREIDGSNTPRQRELWDQLLPVDHAPISSPGTLGLPGLILSDEFIEPSASQIAPRRITWAQSQVFKSRPKRIIDNLYPSDRLQDVEEDSSEGCGGNSSDSLSTTTESEVSATNGAVTGQTSPSANSQTRIYQSIDNAMSGSAQPVMPIPSAGLKVTYARQRSYLTESDLDDVAMLSMPMVPEPVSDIGSRRRGRREDHPLNLTSTQRSEDDYLDGQDSQGGAMRSIHELRKAGGNIHLISELEAMLDDIEEVADSSSSLRRTRLIDLVIKLQEHSSCRLFLDQGLEPRLLRQVNRAGDLITKSLFATAILQLLADATSTVLLAQAGTYQIVSFLVELLGLEQDLKAQSRMREYNLSKYARQEYMNVCTSTSASQAWRVTKPAMLNCHVLALQCLEYLVRQTRESGCLSETLSAYAIRRIVATSIPPCASLPPPRQTPMSGIVVELAISILESCTISNAIECQQSLWEGETLERVVGLLPLLDAWEENECATSRTLTLRLYVNLTNNSPGLCEEFSTPDIVKVMVKMIDARFKQLADHAIQHQHQMLRDNLILSLGAFVNLAESSDIVRRLITDLRYEGRPSLDILLELFIAKSKNAAEVTRGSDAWLSLC